MASGYDLSLAPDSRFLKFRDSYTSREHALDLYDAMRTHTAISAAGHAATVEGLQRISGQLDGMTWAIEAGFNLIAGEITELRRDVREGFRGMQEAFAWGIARLCWEQEQNRAVYRQILDVLQHPLQTQALELRRRAERAIGNKWWDDAASDLQAALENNRYDYLAHLQLARVMWFEYGQWDPAMEQFELAARYADTADGDESQRYYAALAYSHVSLLWRMEAQTHPESAPQSLEKAASAAKRAVELAPTLAVAVGEQVVDFLELSDRYEAQRAMDRAVRADEELLLALEGNPDTARRAEVRGFVDEWRRTHAPLVQEARAVVGSAEGLIKAQAPSTLPAPLPSEALAADLGIHGTTPRSVVLAALSAITPPLDAAQGQLSDALQRGDAAWEKADKAAADARAAVDKAQDELRRAERSIGATGDALKDSLEERGIWHVGLGCFVVFSACGGAAVGVVLMLLMGLGNPSDSLLWAGTVGGALAGVSLLVGWGLPRELRDRRRRANNADSALDEKRDRLREAKASLTSAEAIRAAAQSAYGAFIAAADGLRGRIARLREQLK